MSGAAVAPIWVAQLDFARDWAVKPWELFGGRKLLWWYRWKTQRDARIKIQQAKNG